MNIEIYCDGSSDGISNARGGWAFVVVVDGEISYENSGNHFSTTNNVMEVRAAIEGVRYVLYTYTDTATATITVVSDSKLVLGYITGDYKCKTPHLIPDYMQLRGLCFKLKPATRWVKGHSGDKLNDRCDALAKSAKEQIPKI